jgi:hypothetical protein
VVADRARIACTNSAGGIAPWAAWMSRLGGPAESSGGLFGRIRFHPIGIRCNGCAYSKVTLPVVLAQPVGCDCQLQKFRPRMKCRQCGERRATIRALEIGEQRLW